MLLPPPFLTRSCLLLIAAWWPVAAQAAIPHPSLPPPVIPDCLGVNIHFTDPKPGELEMLAAAGFKWVRMDLSWAAIERKNGEYDFSAYDRLVAALDSHKLRAVFILDYGNPLYAEPGDKQPFTSRVDTDEFRNAFARWAAAAVRHFRGHGYLWEMWNEPNGDGFWKPKADVRRYIALARATGEALRSAGLLGPKGEAFIGPATSTIDLPYLEACFKAGLLDFWDAVSVHPYRQSAPETVEEEYRSLRLLIAKYRPGQKVIPIISGEWGYSTGWKDMGEEKQGKYLPREFLTNIVNDVALSIWYDWHDDGANPKDPEHHFGIVGHDYREGRDPVYDSKPAYVAMKTLTEQLAGYRFNKALVPSTVPSGIESEARLGVFTKGSQVKLAAWYFGRYPGTFEIPAVPGAFDAVTHDGKSPTRMPSTDAGLSFPPVDSPSYLAPQHEDDALKVIAGNQRLPLELSGHAFTRFDDTFRFRNPLRRSIKAGEGFGYDSISPGKTAGLPSFLDLQSRSSKPESAQIAWGFTIDTGKPLFFLQRTFLVCTNPLEIEAYPPAKGVLVCRLRNLTAEQFAGTLQLIKDGVYVSPVAQQAFNFASGENEKIIKLSFGDTILDERLQLLVIEPHRMVRTSSGADITKFIGGTIYESLKVDLGLPRLIDQSVLAAAKLIADGDRKVTSEQSLVSESPPDGPPLTSTNDARLSYKASAGWKFFQVIPGTGEIPLVHSNSSPEDASSFPRSFGVFIHGDGKGCAARIRFKDSTGQTFQSDGPKIDWEGWRYVTIPMQPSDEKPLAHWGGANDGVVHYPIRWDTLFLLDNVSRQAVEGEIFLSAPTVIY